MKRVVLAAAAVAALLLSGCASTGFHFRYTVRSYDPCPPVVRVYRAPRTVVVTERVWDDCRGWIYVRRTVTACWYEERSCYGWYDRYGYFHPCD